MFLILHKCQSSIKPLVTLGWLPESPMLVLDNAYALEGNCHIGSCMVTAHCPHGTELGLLDTPDHAA